MGSYLGGVPFLDPLRGLGWPGSESALACQGGCGAKFGEDAIGPYGPMSVLSLGIILCLYYNETLRKYEKTFNKGLKNYKCIGS